MRWLPLVLFLGLGCGGSDAYRECVDKGTFMQQCADANSDTGTTEQAGCAATFVWTFQKCSPLHDAAGWIAACVSSNPGMSADECNERVCFGKYEATTADCP